MIRRRDAWWGMNCWNGLSAEQQRFLVVEGYLPFGYVPQGDCPNGAEVEITTMYDETPGPRFYCAGCGSIYLQHLREEVKHDEHRH
jgi:hypothetical protein